MYHKPCKGINKSNAITPTIEDTSISCHKKYVTKTISNGPIHK